MRDIFQVHHLPSYFPTSVLSEATAKPLTSCDTSCKRAPVIFTGDASPPPEVVEGLRQRAQRILPCRDGIFDASEQPALLEKITDELLVVADGVVAAVVAEQPEPRPSGREQQRLLAWAVADARGATGIDRNLALTVGKRLQRQAQNVQNALAAAAADAEEKRKSARAAADGDAALTAALPGELAAIDEAEARARQAPRDEVYVGFHELDALLNPRKASAFERELEAEAGSPLPSSLDEEPEEGPERNGLLQRALQRILVQRREIEDLGERLAEHDSRRSKLILKNQMERDEERDIARVTELTLLYELIDADVSAAGRAEEEEERWRSQIREVAEECHGKLLDAACEKIRLQDRVTQLGAEVKRLRDMLAECMTRAELDVSCVGHIE